MNTTPKPRRRWYQLRLRTLLVLVLLLLMLLASWFAVKLTQARRQREAVVAIRELGGTVYYGGWLWNGLILLGADVWEDDFFGTVWYVEFCGKQVTDSGLEYLKGLTQLRQLGLQKTLVTDAGLEHLKGLTKLQMLDLSGTQVTDAGLEHLKGLTQLQYLRLWHSQVTDAGVKRLQQALPNCKITRPN